MRNAAVLLILALLMVLSVAAWYGSRPPDRIPVNSTTFDGTWPLTVPQAFLIVRDTALFVETADGKLWPLNGAAGNLASGPDRGPNMQPDLFPIWRVRDDLPGARVSVSDLITFGLGDQP